MIYAMAIKSIIIIVVSHESVGKLSAKQWHTNWMYVYTMCRIDGSLACDRPQFTIQSQTYTLKTWHLLNVCVCVFSLFVSLTTKKCFVIEHVMVAKHNKTLKLLASHLKLLAIHIKAFYNDRHSRVMHTMQDYYRTKIYK